MTLTTDKIQNTQHSPHSPSTQCQYTFKSEFDFWFFSTTLCNINHSYFHFIFIQSASRKISDFNQLGSVQRSHKGIQKLTFLDIILLKNSPSNTQSNLTSKRSVTMISYKCPTIITCLSCPVVKAKLLHPI